MRLSFPSNFGVIGTRATLLLSLHIPIRASPDSIGLRGSENSELISYSTNSSRPLDLNHTANSEGKQSQEFKSLLLKQKLNTKFYNRLKIAGVRDTSVSLTAEECSPFPESFKIDHQADVGILTRCVSAEDVCIRDSSSMSGGFCARASDSMSPIDYTDYHAKQDERHLLQSRTCTYSNGTEGGVKCHGWRACFGLDDSFIEKNVGCGSCNGYGACSGISGAFLVFY